MKLLEIWIFHFLTNLAYISAFSKGWFQIIASISRYSAGMVLKFCQNMWNRILWKAAKFRGCNYSGSKVTYQNPAGGGAQCAPPVEMGLKEETFAGRKFRSFAVFWPSHESLFREIFRTEASAKVYSREIQESRVIHDVASKNDEKHPKVTKKSPFY